MAFNRGKTLESAPCQRPRKPTGVMRWRGRLFIANPDLPERFRHGARLNAPDLETFYQGGEKGYVDYPVWEAAA